MSEKFSNYSHNYVTIKDDEVSDNSFLASARGSVKFLSPVTLGSRIGEGNFGEVYNGTWQGAQIAAKNVKNKEIHDKVMQEALILSRMKHFNIVRFFGLSEINGTLWMVMEFVPNGTLEALLSSDSDGFGSEQLLEM